MITSLRWCDTRNRRPRQDPGDGVGRRGRRPRGRHETIRPDQHEQPLVGAEFADHPAVDVDEHAARGARQVLSQRCQGGGGAQALEDGRDRPPAGLGGVDADQRPPVAEYLVQPNHLMRAGVEHQRLADLHPHPVAGVGVDYEPIGKPLRGPVPHFLEVSAALLRFQYAADRGIPVPRDPFRRRHDHVAQPLREPDHGPCMRQALTLVAGQYRWVKSAGQDVGDLPGQVGSVPDSGVEPLSRERRHHVRSVAQQE
jgi:hypothetical protein